MHPADVLQMLATSATKASDALRAALILPEVAAAEDLAQWMTSELTGYQSDAEVPGYRKHRFNVKADAMNGAWWHKDVAIPVRSFSNEVREFAESTRSFRESIASLEALAASPQALRIPWPPAGVTLMNAQIAAGTTGVDSTYWLSDVWFEVPPSTVQGVVEHVRHHALTEVRALIPPDRLAASIEAALPSVPSSLAVHGSGNQVIVASPSASATLAVPSGDAAALDAVLASLGISPEAVAALHVEIDDPSADESTKVMRALHWSKETAKALGVNTAASAASTVLLHYLGHLS